MPDNNSLFAANIRFLRKEKMSMTQIQFAELIGATRGQIVSYEIGESRPKGKVESQLLEKFTVTREQLYNSKLTGQTKAPVHPVTLEKRIEKLETQVELILKLLRK